MSAAEVLHQEKSTAAVFQPVPFHYLETAKVLFAEAKACFGPDLVKVQGISIRAMVASHLLACQLDLAPCAMTQIGALLANAQHMSSSHMMLHQWGCAKWYVLWGAQVRELVEDVCKVRMSKIYAGLQVLQGPMTVKLNNLSAMECNVVRPFFQGSLGQFQALAGVCASAHPLAMHL